MHPHLPVADPDAGFSLAGEGSWARAVSTGNEIPDLKGWEAPSDFGRSGRHHVYGGFYVEVTKNPEKDYVDFVLCRENYGFKSYMIGIPTKDCPESVWEDIIRRNVDSYIAGFIQDIECLENQPM